MKTALILALPALIAAMPAAAQADRYRASGTEPFWSLTIDRGTMTYQPVDGRPVTVAKPRPIIGINGELYRTRRMTVDITHVRCSDGMSDRRYPDTVRVTIGRRTFKGCGGGNDNAVENRLAGTNWTIAALGGRPVRPSRATVRFTNDRVEGKICNSFGGSYALRRDTLTTEQVVATRMACPGEPMRVESAFLRLIDSPTRVRWQGRDTMVLSGRTGSVTLRRTR